MAALTDLEMRDVEKIGLSEFNLRQLRKIAQHQDGKRSRDLSQVVPTGAPNKRGNPSDAENGFADVEDIIFESESVPNNIALCNLVTLLNEEERIRIGDIESEFEERFGFPMSLSEDETLLSYLTAAESKGVCSISANRKFIEKGSNRFFNLSSFLFEEVSVAVEAVESEYQRHFGAFGSALQLDEGESIERYLMLAEQEGVCVIVKKGTRQFVQLVEKGDEFSDLTALVTEEESIRTSRLNDKYKAKFGCDLPFIAGENLESYLSRAEANDACKIVKVGKHDFVEPVTVSGSGGESIDHRGQAEETSLSCSSKPFLFTHVIIDGRGCLIGKGDKGSFSSSAFMRGLLGLLQSAGADADRVRAIFIRHFFRITDEIS